MLFCWPQSIAFYIFYSATAASCCSWVLASNQDYWTIFVATNIAPSTSLIADAARIWFPLKISQSGPSTSSFLITALKLVARMRKTFKTQSKIFSNQLPNTRINAHYRPNSNTKIHIYLIPIKFTEFCYTQNQMQRKINEAAIRTLDVFGH